jgi:DNA polymerase-3 subunit delta'
VSTAAPSPLPAGLEAVTAEQPAVAATLAAALAGGPSHAYALVGPAGCGKRAVARAFAAELLAEGSDDPDLTRRRVLADPSPHPDLAWLKPPGNQHLVEEVRERVIGAVPYRPFEGERRVFVIEEADAMAEESQNALLKTLEEPPGFVHILLVSSEPAGLLPTVRSRCQQVTFAPLPRAVLERRLAEQLDLPPERLAALAALADGDLERGRFLGSERGMRLRELTEAYARSARRGEGDRPWMAILETAAEVGKREGASLEAAAGARAEELGKGRDADRIRREGADAAKRGDRRARTAAIDLALGLIAAWMIDLVAVIETGAPLRNLDRSAELEADSKGLDPRGPRAAAELAMATRRRLQVNVNEELALESLFHRSVALLGGGGAVV